MRIVHCAFRHKARDARILTKECSSLAAAGHEVILIAPHTHEEQVGGVTIKPLARSANQWSRAAFGPLVLLRAALREDGDVYVLHEPLQLIPVGFAMKIIGRRVVYDAHEDSPRQLRRHDGPATVRLGAWGNALIASVFEWMAATCFDAIVAATPTIAGRFPARKTVTVRNFPILGELDQCDGPPYAQRSNHVAYVGGISAVRGAREMVQAMNLLPGSLDAHLSMAGAADVPSLETRLRQLPGAQRVTFLPWQSRDQVGQLLGKARIGLVVLHPLPCYLDAYPVKLFEYMVMGLPVIASDFPLWRGIVEGAGCGLLIDPRDHRALASAIQWLLEHPQEAETMGQCGREAILQKYNWGMEERELLRLFASLAPSRVGQDCRRAAL